MVLQWVLCLASLSGYLFIANRTNQTSESVVDSKSMEYFRHGLWILILATAFYLVWSKSRLHTVQAFLHGLRQPTAFDFIQGNTSKEMQAHVLFRIYRARMLVVFFLCHFIAVLGIVLIWTGAGKSDQPTNLIISSLLLIYYYPSRFFFENLLDEFERQESRLGW
jgi:hypothetical protein